MTLKHEELSKREITELTNIVAEAVKGYNSINSDKDIISDEEAQHMLRVGALWYIWLQQQLIGDKEFNKYLEATNIDVFTIPETELLSTPDDDAVRYAINKIIQHVFESTRVCTIGHFIKAIDPDSTSDGIVISLMSDLLHYPESDSLEDKVKAIAMSTVSQFVLQNHIEPTVVDKQVRVNYHAK